MDNGGGFGSAVDSSALALTPRPNLLAHTILGRAKKVVVRRAWCKSPPPCCLLYAAGVGTWLLTGDERGICRMPSPRGLFALTHNMKAEGR
jgi:hypothetical protein